MELVGIIFGAPIAFVTSAVYTGLALAAFIRWPSLKKPAIMASCVVLALLGVEAVLLVSLGAKSAFAHLHHTFTALHFAVLLFAPPAIANLVLHLTAKNEKKRWFQFSAGAACCWLTCMTVVIGNIMIDEAIMGVDAGRPFYLSEKEPNKAPEPTPPSVTSPAYAGAAPAGVVAHL